MGFLPLMLLCGCAQRFSAKVTVEPEAAEVHGQVYGGQQPVAGATIQMYAVGTTGDGSNAIPLIASPVTSDANGSFNISNTYTCPSTQYGDVYLVATSGNPGLSAGTNNTAIAMMAALGPCANLTSSSLININELTTVAAVWSLGSFMTSYNAIGSGVVDALSLSNAFTLAAELVSTATGTAPGSTAASVPVAELNTLADILSGCVNTAGGTSGDGSACGTLFLNTTPGGGTAPTNISAAALNMMNNPTLNVANLYGLATSTSPFQPTLTSAPSNFTVSTAPATIATIYPATTWNDTNGNPIEVHGGSMVWVASRSLYYWVGEADDNSNNFSGINCYSSPNLTTWTFVGDVLPPQSSGDLVATNVVQRPKLLYNAATSTYVMWMHIDNPGYTLNHAGVATSSTPCGTYTYLGSSKPMGVSSFDIGAFEDTDGSAYLMSSRNGVGVSIYKLSSNYQSVASTVIGASFGNFEGESMMKIGGTYYILFSHETGWSANDDEYATATSLAGPWSGLNDFAPAGTLTYRSQTSWIMSIPGTLGTVYVYMGDRWVGSNLPTSTYMWLPLTVNGTSVSATYYDPWYLNVTDGLWSSPSGSIMNGTYVMTSVNSGQAIDDPAQSTTAGKDMEQYTVNNGANQQWTLNNMGNNVVTLTNSASGYLLDVSGASTAGGALVDQYPANSSTGNAGTNQQWNIISLGSGHYELTNVNSGLALEVVGGSKTVGAGIDQNPYGSNAWQQWVFQAP